MTKNSGTYPDEAAAWAEQEPAGTVPANKLAAIEQVISAHAGDHLFIRVPESVDPAHVGQLIDLLREMHRGVVTATVIVSDNAMSLLSDLVEKACEVMHDAYEQAAAGAGWETNPASRKPWAEVPPANQETMRAAVGALLRWLGGGER